MKWINEKTVQGDPMDTKNYFIPKKEYNIPTVNEGIQEGRKLVFCKDCKYWNKHHLVDIYVCSIHNKEGQYPYLLFEMTADDFCSRGERKDG